MGSGLSSVLKRRRKELGLTLAQIADQMGVSEATVQRWESGNIKSVRHDKIVRLASILSVDPIEIMGWEVSIPSGTRPAPEFVRKPRLGAIACGEPILAAEERGEYDMVPSTIHCDFTLRAKGDSMIGARIADGDIVYIRQQPEVESGEIAAVLIGDEATLKRVYRYGDVLVLRPENPAYREMIFSGDDLSKVKILGKAVAFTGEVR